MERISSSGISNNFYVGKEFANKDLAKERIRAYSVETRRNINFKRNDKRRIRAVCKGVVPSITGKNVFVDKDAGPKEDISRKGKEVIEDAEEDKKMLSFEKLNIASTFLAKHITNLLIMNPEIPVKAIQEQMQKKFHVAVSKTKAFRDKAKAQVHLKGDVKVQYSLLRDYVSELQKCNPDTTGLLPTIARLFPSTEHRAYFSGRTLYDLLINNVCEVFNRQLLEARDSPIITVLEFVREYLMKRIVIVQKEVGNIRIPCKHAIAVIHDMADNVMDVGTPEDWVHDSYKLKTWMKVYSYKVNLVNGKDMWAKFECPTTLLP
ncbi:hypothetical protein Tco_0005114 [Tanacetum coccineum]